MVNHPLGRVRWPAAQAQPVGLVCSGLAQLLAVLSLHFVPGQPGWGTQPHPGTRAL